MNEGDWKRVAATSDVEEEDVLGVSLEGRKIAVYNLKGRFYATDNLCTHEQGCLSDGFVIDDVIECPVHQGRFHIPTGKAKGAPVHIALRTYPVKVIEREIYVQLGAPAPDSKGRDPSP